MVDTSLFDLSGKVALITGASKGMGKSMAEGLAEHGAKVVISSRKQDQCEETAAEINDRLVQDHPSPWPATSVTKSNFRIWWMKRINNWAP